MEVPRAQGPVDNCKCKITETFPGGPDFPFLNGRETLEVMVSFGVTYIHPTAVKGPPAVNKRIKSERGFSLPSN